MGYLAAREGRLWHNGTIRFELWYEDAFNAFARRCHMILAQRQALLARCRASVQRMRDQAGYQIIADPTFKPTGDAIRRRTQAILRNRFYLEGDWRGETPLGNGDAP